MWSDWQAGSECATWTIFRLPKRWADCGADDGNSHNELQTTQKTMLAQWLSMTKQSLAYANSHHTFCPSHSASPFFTCCLITRIDSCPCNEMTNIINAAFNIFDWLVYILYRFVVLMEGHLWSANLINKSKWIRLGNTFYLYPNTLYTYTHKSLTTELL